MGTISMRTVLIAFWCCLGALCNSTMAFSLGILQNYIYGAFEYFAKDSMDTSENSIMHVYATIILMVGCGLCWTLGYINLVMSKATFHLLSVMIMIISTGTLKWWYYTVEGFTVYCVINGFITGLLHVFLSEVISQLSQTRTGLFNGIYGFCFGVSGVVANLIAATYINPGNVKPIDVTPSNTSSTDTDSTVLSVDVDIIERTSNCWFIYTAMFAVCYLPGVYYISFRNNTKEISETTHLIEEAEGVSIEYDRSYSASSQEAEEVSLGLSDSFKRFFGSKEAYFYLSCTVCIGIASLVASDLYKSFGMKVYDNDQFFNLGGIIVPLIGASGRVLWGCLFDYLPEKFIFSLNTLLVTASIIGMNYTRQFPVVYLALVAVVASSLGTMSCLAPAIKKRYKDCSFSLLLGLAMGGEVFGTLYYMLITSFLAHLLTDSHTLFALCIPPGLSLVLSFIVL